MSAASYYETWDPDRPRCMECGHVWQDHRGPEDHQPHGWVGCVEIIPTDDGYYENCYCEHAPPMTFISRLSSPRLARAAASLGFSGET